MSNRISNRGSNYDQRLALYRFLKQIKEIDPDVDPLLDRKLAALFTTFAPGTLANWPREKLYYLRFGRTVRYPLSELQRFMRSEGLD